MTPLSSSESTRPGPLPTETESALRAREERDLHRLTGFSWLHALAQNGLPMREVPEAHWEAEEHPEGHAVAYLRCLCGVSHCLVPGAYPQSCQCQRRFFYDGTRVWALNGPAEGN